MFLKEYKYTEKEKNGRPDVTDDLGKYFDDFGKE